MMDENAIKAAAIKESRREVLRVLNVMYHIGPFGFEAICGALLHLQLPDKQCVMRDLTYLADKGYVEWTNRGRGFVPWKERVYRLTAKGNEIAAEITEDPALDP